MNAMTKDEVLSILLGSEGDISGEEISARLHISRAAVNNAVRALRDEGYAIDSATRKGYRLIAGPDRLCPGELLYRLGRERMERVIVLDSVDSTNTYLKKHARELPDGTVCMANEQTGGRGRMGRSFHSPMNEGVYISCLMKPNCAPAETMGITAMAAVETGRALETVTGLRPGIKWVNDLELDGKKLVGILTELGMEAESGRIQYLIVGVGINVKERAFPPELRDIATSLALSGADEVSRCDIAAEMVRRLDALRRDFLTRRERYLSEFRANCTTLGREISYWRDDRKIIARAEDVDESFGLIVSNEEGRSVLRAGEVSVRKV